MPNAQKTLKLNNVVIRFSGDSGDGMQLTGTLFSDTSALLGNSVSTFPDFPSEIRAPQGTVAGVSGFQVHIGSQSVNTPGDFCDILVAMNPAALIANAKWMKKGGTAILDADEFDQKKMERAGFKTLDPVEELKLQDYNVIFAPISSLTKEALADSGLEGKAILRSKNMFALGICYYLFNFSLEHTEAYFQLKFGKKPEIVEANKKVLHGGYNYAANTHLFANTYNVEPMHPTKGRYRSISGNTATAWGLIAAAEKAKLSLFCGSYPITPATSILEELAKHKELGVKAIQMEDEIAGICTAIGAAFAGSLAVTTTSGPGLSLKSEALGLAVITELPLVVVNVQRAGPSTGIPTKTEQGDLAQALYGRNGEAPMVVMAALSPSGCFDAAFYAAKIAVEYMVPVLLLTDGFLGNGSEPWKIPSMNEYPDIHPQFAPTDQPYQPYFRNPENGGRYWAIPGTKGHEHRIGGLEKDSLKGSPSSDAKNHQIMTIARREKVAGVVVPNLEVCCAAEGDVLVVGWGSTYGHLLSAVERVHGQGEAVGLAQFSYILPLPANTAEIFSKFKKILVCELNDGQFANYLRTKLPQFTYHQFNKVEGQPFTSSELKDQIRIHLTK